MRKWHQLAIVTLLLTATAAAAQERITPEGSNSDAAAVMTTRDGIPVDSPFAAMEAQPPTSPSPQAASPDAPPAPKAPFATFSPKVPFGRAEKMPVIPSGPHQTAPVPVVSVDSVEAAEPAPPAPIDPATDPAQENPENPTELTSPIFDDEEVATKQIAVLRALNKVTAQSQTITLRPNETTQFGQLEITAIACRTSNPKSQTDYAALLDIAEKLPTNTTPTMLFRGWMYASSASITSLEHPVYDVTMVECRDSIAPKKDEAKDPKKPGKKGNS